MATVAFGKVARAVDDWEGQSLIIFDKHPLYILLWAPFA